MAIRELVLLPDPRLRETCAPIDVIDDDIKQLAQDMLETMYDAPGIGLAAPQIGVLKRLIVVDVAERAAQENAQPSEAHQEPDPTATQDEESAAPLPPEKEPEQEPNPNPLILINPELVARSEERSVYQEGCLSIPDVFGEVERPRCITVRFLDLEGSQQELHADGLLATCLQHEIDHINGVLFIDHLSRLKRERITKKFAKLARQRDKTARTA